jgi:hypothetical protein
MISFQFIYFVEMSTTWEGSPSRSRLSMRRSVSFLDVTLDIRYSTLPRTLECTLNSGPPAANLACSPLAAVEV